MAISLALTATLDLQSRTGALTSNPSSKAISLALAGSPSPPPPKESCSYPHTSPHPAFLELGKQLLLKWLPLLLFLDKLLLQLGKLHPVLKLLLLILLAPLQFTPWLLDLLTLVDQLQLLNQRRRRFWNIEQRMNA